MEAANPTYVFQNGRVFAIVAGKVVASGSDVEQVEAILAAPEDTLPKTATHIVTPNGLKGQILGRHNDVWGDTVTVRFENGQIRSFHTAASDDYDFISEEPEAPQRTAAEELEERLDEDFATDKESLTDRLDALADIEHKAAAAIRTASHDDSFKLDGIVTMARHEAAEIRTALEAYDDNYAQNGYAAPAPFQMEAAEQESVGGGNSSWLDHTLSEMIAEAEATDYDNFMDEGPEALVADTEDAALADAGVVRAMASSHVRSRVAGVDPAAAAAFESAFLERVEQVRRQEVNNRKHAAKIEKEASVAEDFTGPDDALFM
jgi:hypothetical protein